jgi:hypothetical protein
MPLNPVFEQYYVHRIGKGAKEPGMKPLCPEEMRKTTHTHKRIAGATIQTRDHPNMCYYSVLLD